MIDAEKKYFEIMSKKSGQERLKIAMQLRSAVLELAKTAIIDANPKISSEELHNKLQERIYGTSGSAKRRLKKRIFGKYIYIISPEDLILEKLLWIKELRSDKHMEDIKSIIEISKPDLNYIKSWAMKTSTYDILEEIIDKL